MIENAPWNILHLVLDHGHFAVHVFWWHACIRISVHIQSWFSSHSSQYSSKQLKSSSKACRHTTECNESFNICMCKKHWSHGLSQGAYDCWLDLQGSAITSQQFRPPDKDTFTRKAAPRVACCSQAGALQAQHREEQCYALPGEIFSPFLSTCMWDRTLLTNAQHSLLNDYKTMLHEPL